MKEVCASSLSLKRWFLREEEESRIQTLIQKLNLSPFLARLLALRGHNHETAPHFLEPSLKSQLPDPLMAKDMEKAVSRVVKAIEDNEKIFVWGDYDVDGATSSALLCRYFKAIGHPISLYIPDRLKEGYGPNSAGINKFKERGYHVMITVDCGTTAFDALDETGMDVIILDHHAPEARLPKVFAVVNPHRLDERPEVTNSLGSLAAVGMSFLFIVALNRALRNQGVFKTRDEPDLLSLLDLVALGTVCDVMPLTGLNRTFVLQGLKVMGLRKNLGLKTLADRAGLESAPSPYHLGFMLGPRINAGGRVGESFLGARLLSTENPEEAMSIADQLENYNLERRALENEAYEQALLQVDPEKNVIVVHREGWHEGIIGIIAGRLKEKFNKPAAVITWSKTGLGKGSARSIPGFNFGNLVQKAHHLGHILGGGGHGMAAGFSLKKEQLPLFINHLETEFLRLEKEIDLSPLLKFDGYLDLRSLTPALLREIETLEPFGMGNPSPKFVFSEVMVRSAGVIKDQHIRCSFTQSDGIKVDGIGFRLYNTPLGAALLDREQRPLDLLASPKLDHWNGRTKVSLTIEDAVYSGSRLRLSA